MIKPRYSLGLGEWFVPHAYRRHYGDELLDKLNQTGGVPAKPAGYATGGYVEPKQIPAECPPPVKVIGYVPNPLVKRGIPLSEWKLPEVMQKPTVGRIVHYRSYGTPNGEYLPEARAAIITEVAKGEDSIVVSLCVLNPTGMFFKESVNYSVEAPGCWSWPPRDSYYLYLLAPLAIVALWLCAGYFIDKCK